MCSSTVQTRPGELWQQSTHKWQQSSMALWRRSTSVLSHSKNRCHQTTMEAWHRSADTWVHSKTRCRQSTAEALNKSASKWHQPTDRFYQQAFLSETKSEGNTTGQSPETKESSTPPSSSSHSSQSPISSSSPSSPTKLSQSFQSLPKMNTDMGHMVEATASNNLLQMTPEKQILNIIDSTDQVLYQAASAKKLKSFEPELLGEIEFNWIFSTVSDADNAARDLAKLVEPYRLEILKHKGKLRSASRKRWTLEDSQLAIEQQSRLALFQSRLERAVNHLTGDITPPISPEQSDGTVIAELCPSDFPHRTILAELPTESYDAPPFHAELPARLSSDSDSDSASSLAELPGDWSPVRLTPLVPVPKIIVTQPPDENMLDYLEISIPEQCMYESYEIDGTLHWDETRNSIRMQQSESLANIVAKMDLNRNK